MDYEKVYKEALETAKCLLSQKSVEWTDEDVIAIFPELVKIKEEKIINSIREVLLDTPAQELINKNVNLGASIDWLEKQKELLRADMKTVHKSAESEDERTRKWIYSLIENLGCPADEEAEKELEEMQPRALAWLKSLRPQPKWKPTGEQLSALGSAIHPKEAGILLLKEIECLKSLYHDLKAL